jgi:hypothetical protein
VITTGGYTTRQNIQNTYNNYTRSGAKPGYNGLTGFKKWECYMIVKYGNSEKFGVGGDEEYLIELPIYPDQVSETITPEWQSQSVLGRSSPIAAYANTSLKNVSFSMDLHRDLLTGSFSHTQSSMREVWGVSDASKDRYQAAGLQKQTERGPFSTRSWYVSINKMLQIACYPQYTSIGMIPPTTYFVFGQMILKGFVQSYSTQWQKPIINTFYGWNSVTINMDCYPDSIISAKDMITDSGEGTASTQNTYNTKFPDNVGDSNVMLRDDTTNRYNSRTSSSIGGSVRDT